MTHGSDDPKETIKADYEEVISTYYKDEKGIHTLIALKSLLRGLRKLILNADVIRADLQKNWAVVAEAIQTILRREGYPEPYEALKALTRTHKVIDEKTIAEFVNSLDLPKSVKKELLKITPESYTGICNFD